MMSDAMKSCADMGSHAREWYGCTTIGARDHMTYEAINFNKKFNLFHDQWRPKVVAEMNDYQFKVVRLQGDFIWHDRRRVRCSSFRRELSTSRTPNTRSSYC